MGGPARTPSGMHRPSKTGLLVARGAPSAAPGRRSLAAPAPGVVLLVAVFASIAAPLAAEPPPPPPPPPAAVPPPPPDDPARKGERRVEIDRRVELNLDDGDLEDLRTIIGLVRSRVESAESAESAEDAGGAASILEEVVPVLVPGMFFLTIVGIVVSVLVARVRREKELHDTLRSMIERGVEIPPALLVAPAPKVNDRRRGIVLLSAGVGTTLFFALAADEDAWAFGLVPLFLGAGYLVAWWLERHDPS